MASIRSRCSMPVPKPASDVEGEILQFFCESDPSTAFTAGFNDYAGRLFIPSTKNRDKFARRLEELRLRAENESQLKALDSWRHLHSRGATTDSRDRPRFIFRLFDQGRNCPPTFATAYQERDQGYTNCGR